MRRAFMLLEGQTRQALTSGFDLARAFLHADRQGCDALVYDVMELARPMADNRVLAFLPATTFHTGDFIRVSDGSCRLHPQLARGLVATCRVAQQGEEEQAAWPTALLRRSPVRWILQCYNAGKRSSVQRPLTVLRPWVACPV